MPYDPRNIFAKIIRKEVSAKLLYEDEWAIAFADMAPAAPVHILLVPKGEFVSFDDFAKHAPADLVQGFFKAVQKVAAAYGVDGSGYRLISNHGTDAHQTVPHFHVHLLGGQPLGGLLAGDGLAR